MAMFCCMEWWRMAQRSNNERIKGIFIVMMMMVAWGMRVTAIREVCSERGCQREEPRPFRRLLVCRWLR